MTTDEAPEEMLPRLATHWLNVATGEKAPELLAGSLGPLSRAVVLLPPILTFSKHLPMSEVGWKIPKILCHRMDT